MDGAQFECGMWAKRVRIGLQNELNGWSHMVKGSVIFSQV